MIPMDRPITLTTMPVVDKRPGHHGIRWQRIDLGGGQWISVYEDGSFHAHGLGPAINPHGEDR